MSSDVHADAATSEPKEMISKEELAASYGKSAAGYESMLDQEVIDKKVLYDKIVDMLLSGLGELEGPVADVSCGPGHVLAMLQERQKARPLMGSDLCQGMPCALTFCCPRKGCAMLQTRAHEMRRRCP